MLKPHQFLIVSIAEHIVLGNDHHIGPRPPRRGASPEIFHGPTESDLGRISDGERREVDVHHRQIGIGRQDHGDDLTRLVVVFARQAVVVLEDVFMPVSQNGHFQFARSPGALGENHRQLPIHTGADRDGAVRRWIIREEFCQ